jgi:DNA topoisomerase II
MSKKPKVVKSDSDKYDKLSPREHILLRPDTYIGDIEATNELMWIYKNDKMVQSNINFVPGFLKIFDEILVNARDASINDPSCDVIKVNYNKEEGYISVFNNGDIGIPVEVHSVHKVLTPSMIFGELLTSSNYDDNDARTTGGRNGYGAKLSGIFSTLFIVMIDDAKRGKRFYQEWKDNMSVVVDPIVTKLPAKTKSSVTIKFYPDLKRFKLKDLDNIHYELFNRRTIDIAGTSNKIKVFFNDSKIEVNNFKQYIDLYYPDETLFFDSNDNWSVGCIYKSDNGKQNSFVNGINTYHGGTHVNYVMDNIIKVLINDYIKKKNKDIKVTNQMLKDHLIFFINSTIVNPSFSSQTKDTLTTKVDKFGSKYEPSDAFLKKLAKCGIVEQVVDFVKFKESSNLKKTDGKKTVKITGIPKLEDASKAGTKDSSKCTLILTEGDSAKATAMAGLSVIGKDYYGILPMKGKVLNIREASTSQLLNNEEINNIKTIMGLKQGEDYSSDAKFATLRYGKIIVFTDQDHDGSHIKGLIMNLFHSLWSSLLKRDGFIQSLNTPIVKAKKGNNVEVFYNMTDYNTWKEKPESNNYKIKYYKGLGTSTSEEAKEYFVDMNKKLINYVYKNKDTKAIELEEILSEEHKEGEDDEYNEDNEEDNSNSISEEEITNSTDDDAIRLAFEKNKANDRKKWLMKYDKNKILDYKDKQVSYHEFINYDLIHFSNADLNRSIPSIIDGLKPSQRKILFGAYLRGLDKEEIKVSQLAGFVSDKAAYHHGEASLTGAIIGLAQNFVGSNNINILKPIGQYGSILRGGKDSASPRYIFTMLEVLTTTIFNEMDNPVLTNQYEDGMLIEPEFYCPIIPMVLINGIEGIGTGFSTKIPPYNPLDIISNLRNIINGKNFKPIDPWWHGFNGSVKKIDDSNYIINSIYKIEKNKVIITQLPVGEWSSNYKEFLEKLLLENDVKETKTKKKEKKANPFIDYTYDNTDIKVHFELIFEDNYLNTIDISDFEKKFHLSRKYSITNMHLYNSDGCITKYKSIESIVRDYYKYRLDLYQKRKDYLLNQLSNQLEIISWKVKFLLMICEDKLIINKKKKQDIESELIKLNFPKLSKNNSKESFDYLLGMELYNLTFEKIEELKKQEKEKQTEYDNLNKQTIEMIWLNELSILENKYNEFIKHNIVVENKNNKKKK